MMKLSELCRAAGILCPDEAAEGEILGISSDSVSIREGELFVCIRGLHRDGHAYIEEALAAGAAGVICEVGRGGSVPAGHLCIEVPDTREAEARLWDAWYGHPSANLSCIGVTGTNGKTSVTHLIKAILEADGRKCGIIGTVGSRSGGRSLAFDASDPLSNMTTPEPRVLYRLLSEMQRDGVNVVVMEVSSHALAQRRVAPMHFRASVFTNLTPEHLDFHQSMEEYAAVKARLFAESDCAILNVDSPYAMRMMPLSGEVVGCSAEGKEGCFRADRILTDASGVRFRLCYGEKEAELHCPIPGRVTVMNAMQAAAVCLTLGVPMERVSRALASVPPVPGRMERVTLDAEAEFDLIIDYAHTPDALEKLLHAGRELLSPRGRLVALFGCGGDRDRTKRPLMGRIAGELSDFVILTADNSRSEDTGAILAEIAAGLPPHCMYSVFPDRAEAIRYAILSAEPGDLILLCGKGHEEYEIDRHGRRYFSEKEIARAALEIRRRRERGEPG